MFRIKRTDKDGASRFVGESHESVGLAVHAMVRAAFDESASLPNNPFVDQCGHRQVAIYMGVYPIIIYEVVEV